MLVFILVDLIVGYYHIYKDNKDARITLNFILNVCLYPAQPSVTSLTSISLNSTTVLTCTTTGSPATTVTWTRDGQPVTIDGRTYNMVQTVINRASATYENVLTVSEPASGNTFTCTVANALGSDTSD